jgi:hypothetical protein
VNYSWNGVGYATIYPPAANGWVTYSYAVPGVPGGVKHLQLQLQGSGAYSGPVTNYIGNVTIQPYPNPVIIDQFTGGGPVGGGIDTSKDSPYVNPVLNSAPVNITPAGSWLISIGNPGGYNGWNQYGTTIDYTHFQWFSFDVYLDGSSGSTYGGIQMLAFKNDWSGLNYVTSVNFNASMVGHWTHFNVACSGVGLTASPAFVFQGIPGSDGGTDTTTFHIDNIQMWNPVIQPKILSLTPGTPGGVQVTLDANGNSNVYDQEGFTSPSTNNASTDFFWINQTPATYSFTLTNFPSPASAPSFDAHIYLANGDSLAALWNGAFGYNQTYSGVPYNAPDYLGFHVQNSTNGGVVAVVDWKTNAPNGNAGNVITFNFPTMASANGTWAMHFTDNTHGNVVAADGSVNSFTLPDFSSDPNYTANFTPASSMVQFGVFKNGNTNNNSRNATISGVLVTNNVSGVIYNDTFSGPGLTANNNWQIAEYYQFAAVRAIWQPYGTAYWLKWNTTAAGWSVMSSSNSASGWNNAGVTYTYADSTGTNLLGAVPTASLPVGKVGLFRLQK